MRKRSTVVGYPRGYIPSFVIILLFPLKADHTNSWYVEALVTHVVPSEEVLSFSNLTILRKAGNMHLLIILKASMVMVVVGITWARRLIIVRDKRYLSNVWRHRTCERGRRGRNGQPGSQAPQGGLGEERGSVNGIAARIGIVLLSLSFFAVPSSSPSSSSVFCNFFVLYSLHLLPREGKKDTRPRERASLMCQRYKERARREDAVE